MCIVLTCGALVFTGWRYTCSIRLLDNDYNGDKNNEIQY